jgi:putative transposase
MAEYDTRNRRTFSLRVRLIFVTKYRKPLLTGDVRDSLMRVTHDICNKRQWRIIACETDVDHVHILLSYDTTDCVSDMVKVLKQESTYRLWALFHDELSRHY